MKQAKKQEHQEAVNTDSVILSLLKITLDTVKDATKLLEKHLDTTERSKLPKIEEELLFFFLFSIDYWIQTEYISEESRNLRQKFNTHLANIFDIGTIYERFTAYAQITNEKKGDIAKFLGFGMKLSEYCDLPHILFLELAPHLFTTALQYVSVTNIARLNKK